MASNVSDDRCSACGCFLEIRGAWVGESHYDEEAIVSCNNPKCRTNKRPGVGTVQTVDDLPSCFEWKQIAGTHDFENQYGHVVEVVSIDRKPTRCESCQHLCVSPPSREEPYGDVHCGKGHWEGGPFPGDAENDAWKNCPDFTHD